MPLQKSSNVSPRFITFATLVVAVAVLRLASEVTIPLALALLLAFLLSPVVTRLSRWLPKAAAITLSVSIAITVIGIAAWQLTTQAVSLLQDLPHYEDNLRHKIDALQKPEHDGSWQHTLAGLERMEADIFAPFAKSENPAASAKKAPVAVEVHPSDPTPLELARNVVAKLLKPIGTAGVVIVFVVAILFQRDDLRSRFIRVISGGQLNTATQAIDDAAQRVSRYLIAQLLVNSCFGLCIGTGLWFIGVPHAALWGVLAGFLRFIPFLGAMIAASFPLLLGIAVDPGWSMVLWTSLLFFSAELLTSNVIEVLVYGTSTGISTLALLTAAVFWSWLWGLPGLFLSTPLTVCLLVIGQYVPGLKFLGVLLGSEPALNPAAQLYQRMLAMNQEDLFSAAESYIEQHSLAAFYDDVFVPALFMAEVDRHSGALAEVRQKFIFESSAELIEELGQRNQPRNAADPSETDPSVRRPGSKPRVVGLAARDEADELVGSMLAHLLRENGFAVEMLPLTSAAEGVQQRLRAHEGAAFISALPPSTLSAAARLCRQAKHLRPGLKVLVGMWSADAKLEDVQGRLRAAGADSIALKLADAVEQMRTLVEQREGGSPPTPETPATPALERTEPRLEQGKPEEATDAVVRELARAFHVPSALVTVLEIDPEFWHHTRATGTTTPFTDTPVNSALAAATLLIVEDTTKDSRFDHQPELTKRGVRFIASAPLRTRSGHHVGNLCVLDTQPRTLAAPEKQLLEALAAQLVEAIEPPAAAGGAVTPGN